MDDMLTIMDIFSILDMNFHAFNTNYLSWTKDIPGY